MKKLFGTDGIRGVAGSETMNEVLAFKLGKALMQYCRKNKITPVIIIGRDTRASGPLLELAVSRGIVESGGKIISAGIIPTPAIAYLAKKESAGLGLVISASHNPYNHNGFKIFKNDGAKLTDLEEEQIEKLIAGGKARAGRRAYPAALEIIADSNARSLNDYNKKYAEFLINILNGGNLKGLKIVLDCANGATFKVAPYIFKKLDAEAAVIFNSPNGKNINKACGSEHAEDLQKAVLKKRADIGLAFDGDGDRLIAIDEKGERLTGDHLLYICAKMLKKKDILKNNLVASTSMSNIGFINGLRNLGIRHFQTDVGDRQVYRALVNEKAVLGGEESGHIIFLDYHTTGDGILSGLMLLSAMKYFNKPLSELAKEVYLAPKILINVKVKTKPDFSTVPEINKAIKDTEKYLGAEGRVLVRYSGTELLCRIMVEGKDEKEIKNLAEKIGEVIENKLN
ncbi:MAG: phosphoglucosamine mutase [Patescibacteria group bacterium]|jgi:phosphoglucosamine mutase